MENQDSYLDDITLKLNKKIERLKQLAREKFPEESESIDNLFKEELEEINSLSYYGKITELTHLYDSFNIPEDSTES